MTDIIELARNAGAETQDGGKHWEFDDFDIAKFEALIRADERSKSQSFSDKHPPNLSAKCKCEHWQACKECHPTAFKGATP